MKEIESDDKPSLVVTGSSAGGIDALMSLVTGLPADFPAAILVAQHLDPAHVSRLQEILAQRSTLPVVALDGSTELVPGKIYVVPSDRDVVVVDGKAVTSSEPHPGPRPSVDRLFTSAAEYYGERLIGIVFSGMGSDGLVGARAIKEHGGTVVIQDPSTASHPSMPLAIPPTLVDLIARPEAMGGMLSELIRATRAPIEENEQRLLRTLLGQLRERTGIDFFQYKMPTIMRRLSRLMVENGADSIADYLRHLQTHPEGYGRLVSAFLINVTEFFRDGALYEELKSTVLPRLIQEAAGRNGELRIWSAGTSTGEEAYSLAILCAELLRESDISVRIFATDVDEDSITFARRGVYGAEALRQLPAEWIERYFVRIGESYEVGKRIRNMTVFGQHDLAQRSPFPQIDLCTCRNVLIYFTRELQTRALQLFAFSLRDGGFLVLGKAESTTPLAEYFRPANPALKIFQRQGERILIPPTRIRDSLGVGAEPREAARTLAPFGLIPGSRTTELRPTSNEAIGALIGGAPVAFVVVDREYDIVSINSAARTMLDIHGVGVGEDLVHLLHGLDAARVREMIDGTFRAEMGDPIDLRAGEDDTGRRRWLRFMCYGNRRGVSAALVDTVAVVVFDVSADVTAREDLERIAAERGERVATLTERLTEMAGRQKSLLKANDDLTLANVELRTLNEQLLLSAEEGSSAHEEIETLNEEMQATNEELETLNEELQATVEELNTTNDELEARGVELERLSEVRETYLRRIEIEHEAVLAVLRAMPLVLAVVGTDGEVVYASDAVANWVVGAEGSWWQRPGPVQVNGRTYAIATETIPINGTPYQLVEFRLA